MPHPALGAQSLSHWINREVSRALLNVGTFLMSQIISNLLLELGQADSLPLAPSGKPLVWLYKLFMNEIDSPLIDT